MVDISTIDGLCRLSLSKLLLRALCQKRRAGGHATEAWLEPEAYLPPAEVLRTIRDYSSDMQELAHSCHQLQRAGEPHFANQQRAQKA